MLVKNVFKRIISLVLMCFIIFEGIPVTIALDEGVAKNMTRSTLNFNSDWRYIQGDVENAWLKDFDDKSWVYVNLPHSTKFVDEEDTKAYLGISWYRKKFVVDDIYQGGKIYIKFEAAMQCAEVWVNGVKKIRHAGGYTPFTIDITDDVTSGDNIIAVKVDSRGNSEWSPGYNGIDFQYHGGIYRNVSMIITNKMHITDAVYANKVADGGIFVTYPSVSSSSAQINIKTNVINENISLKMCEVKSEILDKNGVVVATAVNNYSINGGADYTFNQNTVISNPMLWHPYHPNLYTLKTTVSDDSGIIDNQETSIGIRNIKWTHNNGLEINGERFEAQGVNKHQEIYGLGNAVSAQSIYYDVKRVKDAGFDIIRGSHYPNSNEFYEACDKLGVMVYNSITGWQNFNDTETFRNNTYQEARDMIRRDRNHPCVVAWETSINEGYYTDTWAQTINNVAHMEYPGDQMYTGGWRTGYFDIYSGASQHGVRNSTDTRPIMISECGDWDFGGSNSTSRVARDAGDAANLVQCDNLQQTLNNNRALSWYSADFYWDFADYCGFDAGVTKCGVVDMARMPKFSYYFYKSQRDPNVNIDGVDSGPMVFIANSWTANSPTTVRIFSNCDQVKLYLNGRYIGVQNPDSGKNTENLKHPPFSFNVGSFEAGELRAEGIIDGEVKSTFVRKTCDMPTSLKISAEGDAPLRADGSDARLLWIDVVDKNGTVCVDNNSDVNLRVDGPGEIVGKPVLKAKGGRLAAWVRAEREAGEISVYAESDGLAAGSITINSEKVVGYPEPPEDYETKVSIALNKTAMSDSCAADSSAQNGNDGNLSTSWIAGNSQESHWWSVDLGSRHTITSSEITWLGEGAHKYKIEISDDGFVWEKSFDNTNNMNVISKSSDVYMADGRYVRITVLPETSGTMGFAEFKMFGYAAAPKLPMNVAMEKNSFSDSSLEGMPAIYGNDGNPGTYWSAKDTNIHWWTVDLGENYDIYWTDIMWQKNNAYQYIIDVSSDNENWKNVCDKSNNQIPKNETIDEFRTQGRFVRFTTMGGVTETTLASFYECKVFALPLSSISQGRTVETLSDPGDYLSSNINDGDKNTSWRPNYNLNYDSIIFDLGHEYIVNGVEISWEDICAHKYTIEVSADKQEWRQILDKSDSQSQSEWEWDTLKALNCRYLKLTVMEGLGVKEFKLYGMYPENNYVLNTSFDDDKQKTSNIKSWSGVTGDTGASYIEEKGRTGIMCHTFWKQSNYIASRYQTIQNLPDGIYTLSFWAKNGGGQKSLYVYAKDNQGYEVKKDIPVSSNWLRTELTNVKVKNGNCTIGFYTDAYSNNYAHIDDVELTFNEFLNEDSNDNYYVGNMIIGKLDETSHIPISTFVTALSNDVSVRLIAALYDKNQMVLKNLALSEFSLAKGIPQKLEMSLEMPQGMTECYVKVLLWDGLSTISPLTSFNSAYVVKKPQDDMLLWYNFDDGNANTARDLSGNSYDGIMYGGIQASEGVDGGGIQLLGNQSYIKLPDGIFKDLDGITVATWVKLSKISQWQRLFDFGKDSSHYITFIPTSDSGNECRIAVLNGGGWSNEQRFSLAYGFKANEWVHVAVTMQDSETRLYINGVKIGSATNINVLPKDLEPTVANYIGKSQYSNDPYLAGTIDDFRIYSKVLTEEEIAVLAE